MDKTAVTPSLAAWFSVMWHFQGLTFTLTDSVVKNGLFIGMHPCSQLCKTFTMFV